MRHLFATHSSCKKRLPSKKGGNKGIWVTSYDSERKIGLIIQFKNIIPS